MGKKWLVFCILFCIGCVAIFGHGKVSGMAANKISEETLKSKYLKWLDKHGYEYGNDVSDYYTAAIKYVDIDGNGIKEMIYSTYALGHVALTFDVKKNSVKKLKAGGGGKGGYAYYNAKKHMISFSSSSTGDDTTVFYKIKSMKAVKKNVIKTWRVDKKVGNSYQRSWKCSVGGKRVSASQYKKALKAALKGYKKVTPMEEYRW